MNQSPTYDKSLIGSTQSKINAPYWDTVLSQHESGKYKDALVGILHYLDPGLAERTGNADQTQFTIPHGSIVVNFEIKDDQINIWAPFVKLPEQNPIPLLRQAAQINFNPLKLAQVVLEDQDLVFRYSCPLELCEPYKMYDVFYEICTYSDAYDDDFIEKFKARRLREPVIEHFTNEQKEIIWNKVQGYVKEAFDYTSYFEEKRIQGFTWDMINITLKRIEFYAAPQGVLRARLEKTINQMQNRGNSFQDQLRIGREFLKKLQNYSREEFDQDLYLAETFVPYKSRTSLEKIKNTLKTAHDRAHNERGKSDFMAATFTVLYEFYNLFYYYNVQNDLAQTINAGMEQASGKKWKEASDTLWQAIDGIMNDRQPAFAKGAKPQKSKSFLSTLFGKS
ncbi:MAG: type III secretion system chaperone [Cyclobacteriaceae bacterium]